MHVVPPWAWPPVVGNRVVTQWVLFWVLMRWSGRCSCQEEGRRKTKVFILRFLKREAGYSTWSLMEGTRVERRPKWLERGEPRPGPSLGFPRER